MRTPADVLRNRLEEPGYVGDEPELLAYLSHLSDVVASAALLADARRLEDREREQSRRQFAKDALRRAVDDLTPGETRKLERIADDASRELGDPFPYEHARACVAAWTPELEIWRDPDNHVLVRRKK